VQTCCDLPVKIRVKTDGDAKIIYHLAPSLN
jgi:hypothetical protein